MATGKQEYTKMAEKASPPSPKVKDTVKAFLFGGAICTLGQGLYALYTGYGASTDGAKTAVSVTLVFLTAVLTGIGVFDKIAKHAGAGTIVPITGFANSVHFLFCLIVFACISLRVLFVSSISTSTSLHVFSCV